MGIRRANPTPQWVTGPACTPTRNSCTFGNSHGEKTDAATPNGIPAGWPRCPTLSPPALLLRRAEAAGHGQVWVLRHLFAVRHTHDEAVLPHDRCVDVVRGIDRLHIALAGGHGLACIQVESLRAVNVPNGEGVKEAGGAARAVEDLLRVPRGSRLRGLVGGDGEQGLQVRAVAFVRRSICNISPDLGRSLVRGWGLGVGVGQL
mmetsp:Transcript_129229/g.223332  ORF Transcript_129229/g.223332 Transcript_129229/m.223332 type:complete len:204 (+) Transcript_129229:191-802(+)